MTDEQRSRLTELAGELRKPAARIGPMHGNWDLIFDIEAFLKGRETMLLKTADEWIDCAELALK